MRAKGVPSVLSMSLVGGSFSQTVNDQANNAINAGILVVVDASSSREYRLIRLCTRLVAAQ